MLNFTEMCNSNLKITLVVRLTVQQHVYFLELSLDFTGLLPIRNLFS
jgi:hypothetical protein